MKWKFVLLKVHIVIICMFLANNCFAFSYEELTKDYAWIGATFEKKNGLVTKLTIRLDEKELLKAIPILKEKGVLNADLPETEIYKRETSYAALMNNLLAVFAVKALYQEDPKTNELNVYCYLSSANDYGILEDHLLFSFGFDRNIFNKIDWKGFKFERLERISKNYKYSQWFKDKVYEEID